MIFAHGPIGFALSFGITKLWKKKMTTREQWWLLFIGFCAGIFPDVDLLYVYFVSAAYNHRELPTHAFLLYVFLFILAYGIALIARSRFWKIAVLVAFVSVFSHILLDSLMGQVDWFMPFSHAMYGLGDWHAWWPYLFAANFIVELGGIVLFFVLLAGIVLSQHRILRFVSIGVALLVLVGGTIGILFVNKHTLHVNLDVACEDIDHDGVRNKDDVDMDGDNIVNSRDVDSDNDGVTNVAAFAAAADNLRGLWSDPSDGRWFEVPGRIGFVSDTDVVRYIFGELGVPLKAEMVADYALSSSGYDTSSDDGYFMGSVHNIQNWLNHTGRLFPTRLLSLKKGDILFFGPNGDTHLAIVRDVQAGGKVLVVESSRTRGVGVVDYNTLIQTEGAPVFVGRILYPVDESSFKK